MYKFLASVTDLGITLVQVNMRPGEVDTFRSVCDRVGIDTNSTNVVTRWVRV